MNNDVGLLEMLFTTVHTIYNQLNRLASTGCTHVLVKYHNTRVLINLSKNEWGIFIANKKPLGLMLKFQVKVQNDSLDPSDLEKSMTFIRSENPVEVIPLSILYCTPMCIIGLQTVHGWCELHDFFCQMFSKSVMFHDLCYCSDVLYTYCTCTCSAKIQARPRPTLKDNWEHNCMCTFITITLIPVRWRTTTVI